MRVHKGQEEGDKRTLLKCINFYTKGYNTVLK